MADPPRKEPQGPPDQEDQRKGPADDPRRPDGSGPDPPPPSFPPLLGLLAILMLVYLVTTWLGGPSGEELSYTEFKHHVRNGEVVEVTFEGDRVRGKLRPADAEAGGGEATGAEGDEPPPLPFHTTKPPYEDPGLAELLEEQGVEVRAESTSSSSWTGVLVLMLPWLLLLGLLFYAGRKMRQRMGDSTGPGGLFGFGRSKARRYRKEGRADTTFDDVAGLENAKRDLREIIAFLREPERFHALGAHIPRGVLLMGPPGTGKTMLARAVAGEADVPFFSIGGSEFIEMFVGVGASRVRDMFEGAKREAPAIIFIDEVDSIGRTRGSGLGGGHDEREQTLNQILAEMDGFSPEHSVVVMAATNRPDVLDPALLRPGRFDRKITLDLPRKEARRQLLEVHTRKVPLGDDVDLDRVAARTVGFSGADLANLVNEAALLAGREGKKGIDTGTFDRARDKIVLGAERETMLGDAEKRRVAFHESGHALLAALLPHTDPLAKVSIIPRGRALGATEQIPEEEHYNLLEGELRERLMVMLGGRIAERLVFDELSSGAADDLQQATRLARMMVSQWGMSERLGPVAFRRGEEHIFLGREMAQQRDFSEHTARLIDDEVRALVTEVESRAQEVMTDHREQLERLAAALLEKEVLEAEAIRELLGDARVRETGRTPSS